jgi:hypothetical protein
MEMGQKVVKPSNQVLDGTAVECGSGRDELVDGLRGEVIGRYDAGQALGQLAVLGESLGRANQAQSLYFRKARLVVCRSGKTVERLAAARIEPTIQESLPIWTKIKSEKADGVLHLRMPVGGFEEEFLKFD